MSFWPPLRHLYQARPRLLVAFCCLWSVFPYSCQPVVGPAAVNRLECAGLAISAVTLVADAPYAGKDIARIARVQDESAGTVLALVCVACLVSILAILFELGEVKHLKDAARYGILYSPLQRW